MPSRTSHPTMTPAQRAALRKLGARLHPQPVTKGQDLPNGGWGKDTKPAKGVPMVKGSPSLDSAKAKPSSYKKGGKVQKTGMAKVHKGERVLTKSQTKKFDQQKFDRARKSYFGIK